MTKRSKAILLYAILLAIAVIFTALLYLKAAMINHTANNGIYFFIIILILGLTSVLVVYLTKIKKADYENLLPDDYYSEYEIVRDIIMTSQLPLSVKREIKNDILDMLINAKEAGKPIDQVIDNAKEFADEILTSYSGKRFFQILAFMDSVLFFALYILGAKTVLWLENTNADFYENTISLPIFILFLIISVLLVFIKRINNTRNLFALSLPIMIGIAFIAAMEILHRYFAHYQAVSAFLNGEVNAVPNLPLLILFILLIPGILIGKSYIRKIHLRKLKANIDL